MNDDDRKECEKKALVLVNVALGLVQAARDGNQKIIEALCENAWDQIQEIWVRVDEDVTDEELFGPAALKALRPLKTGDEE